MLGQDILPHGKGFSRHLMQDCIDFFHRMAREVKMTNHHVASTNEDLTRVVTSAAMRAARLLRITNRELAEILGVSESAVSRAANGTRQLSLNPKTREITALFVRLYRSLDAIVGGEDNVSATWLRSPNSALGRTPLEAIKSIAGLTATLAYLDARRGVV